MELTFFPSSEKKPRALLNQLVKRLTIAALATCRRKERLDVVGMIKDRQSVFVHWPRVGSAEFLFRSIDSLLMVEIVHHRSARADGDSSRRS